MILATPISCGFSQVQAMFGKMQLSNLSVAFGILIWTGLSSLGVFMLWSYGGAPGAPCMGPASWPPASRLSHRNYNTLVFFGHPLCPCTRASIAELAKLAAASQGKCDIDVVFISPQGADPSWHDSDLVASAQRIPGVTVSFDADRREAFIWRAHCWHLSPVRR